MFEESINTKDNREVLDITELINKVLSSRAESGVCNIFVAHTTCSISTADLDPETGQDYLNAFEKIVLKLQYIHPHDPEHMPDHILSYLTWNLSFNSFSKPRISFGNMAEGCTF